MLRFHRDIIGQYLINPAVIECFFDRSSLERGRKFVERSGCKEESFYEIKVKQYGIKAKSGTKIGHFKDFSPLLALYHEQVHHTRLFSTVYGLFLWRLQRQIRTKMGFIIRKLRESDIQRECFFPLLDWYNSVAFEKIKTANPCSDSLFIETIEKLFGISQEQYNRGYAGNIEFNFDQLNLLIQFRNLIRTNNEMTMRDFVEIANKTFQILKENDDLDATIEWKSYNIDAPSYLPPNPISSDDMLEIDARVAQSLILSRHKIPDNEQKKFFEFLFDGDCGRDCGIKLKSLIVTP